MKILVVTNLYPPHHIGGYELGCRDVVEKLRGRGHTLCVLTSNFRYDDVQIPKEEVAVERVLQFNHTPGDPPHHKRVECGKLMKIVRKFAPEVVYFWNQAGLCLWLPAVARWFGCRVAFFLSDTNFVSWRIAAWLNGVAAVNPLIRTAFGRTFLIRGLPILQNRPCHFASAFLRSVAKQDDISIEDRSSAVIHWGIEIAQFAAAPRLHREPPRRLLYVGQMIPQKGVHTAILALGLLAREKEFSEVTLTLAGGGLQPDYERKLRGMPAQLGIAKQVHFLGKVPRHELPKLYAQHDILLFPSEWDEPFAITPLEAMAAGLVVVGTTTGGSGELFRDRETAMTFATGDAKDCARAVRELCADRVLEEALRRRAQTEVTTHYTLEVMIDRIEASLRSITGHISLLERGFLQP